MFFIISLMSIGIAYLIYNCNFEKISAYVQNSYKQVLINNFNYVIVICTIISLIIMFIYSFIKKSIFKIEKIS